MATINPFTPGSSTTATAGTNSAAVALPAGSGLQVWMYNASATIAAGFAFGASTVTAASDGTTPILPPATSKVFTIPVGATYFATKTASSTAVVYITRGDGF